MVFIDCPLIRRGLVAALLPVGLLFGQTTIEFDRLTIESGLSMHTVNGFLQDPEGLLWIATSNGLNRFDGYEVTVFNHDPSDSQSLPFPRVQSLDLDPSGDLWVGTFGGGIGRFNRATETFQSYRNAPWHPTTKYIRSLRIFPEDGDHLWIGTMDSGLCVWNISQNRFQRLSEANHLVEVHDIHRLPDGDMLVGTSQGLEQWHRDGDGWRRTREDFWANFGGTAVHSVCTTRAGDLLFGTANGLVQWTARTGKLDRQLHRDEDAHSISNNLVWSVVADTSDGVFWIGTENGLNRFDSRTGYFKRFFNDPGNPKSINNNIVWDLYRDRQGNIWGGMFGGGAFRINGSKMVFRHIHYDPASTVSIGYNDIYGLFESRENILWVGSDAGLDMIDMARQKRITPEAFSGFGRFPKIARAFYQDRQGHVWIGTVAAGLFRFDIQRGELQQFEAQPENRWGLSHANISAIREDREGFIWVSTRGGGVCVLDRKSGTFRRYRKGPADSLGLTSDVVLDIWLDEDQTLWFATIKGLVRMDANRKMVRHFIHDPADPGTLSNEVLECVFRSSSGDLWVGTLYGLNRMDPSGHITRYSSRDGLPGNKIYAILEDDRRRLWISTADGLSRMTMREDGQPHFDNFDSWDGLQSNEFTQGIAHRNARGEMYFGGVNGITLFHPESVPGGFTPPTVLLTGLRKFDKRVVLEKRLSETDEIVFSHDEDFFGIEFVGLDFRAAKKIRYRYRLEGFDADWIDAGTRRYATYTNLDPGRYRFHVIAGNGRVWSVRPASLDIVVLPPFWQTWWFRIAIAALLAGLLTSIYRIRTQRLVEIERMRVRIASDLHDDIGASLTRIALHSEAIQKADNPDKVRESAQTIGAMSREVIRVMSDVVWSIDARNDTLGNLMTRIRDTAFQVFSPREVEFQFEYTGLNLEKPIRAELRQNIYLIVKEAMHNVVKHSEARTCSVRFQNTADQCVVTISNDGVRHVPDLEGATGSGLRNMKLRAGRIGGKLTVEAGQDFLVRLSVPPL